MMDNRQAELHRFFSEKAKHLQHEIDWEIEKIGGRSSDDCQWQIFRQS